MRSRIKSLLTHFLLCLAPLLLLAIVNYWNGVSAVDRVLSESAQNNLNALIGEVDRRLQDDEVELTRLSLSSSVGEALAISDAKQNSAQRVAGTDTDASNWFTNIRIATAGLLNRQAHFSRISLIGSDQQQLFRAERKLTEQGTQVQYLGPELARQVKVDNPSAVRNTQRSVSLSESNLLFTIPAPGDASQTPLGVLVGEVALSELLTDIAAPLETKMTGTTSGRSAVTVLDNSGKIVYQTNHLLQGQQVVNSLPELKAIAPKLSANQSGIEKVQTATGEEYVAAYAPLPRLNIAIAIATKRSDLISSAHRWGIAGLLLAVACAAVSAFVWQRYVEKKARSIERMTEDLKAIAKGELDRRIELQSSDDSRAIADNINAVTERLRAQMAREAESRQFDSFVRLSAMLTHDLKNAIEALSLTVGNMEQHFDNEQFRADAMRSVAGATDKLKAVVSRLTRPLSSLSGEHKKPLKVDLIPVLKRVVSVTAGPLEHKHKIEMKLPPSLIALVDPLKIDNVIENLVLNAVESMSDRNGTLTITAGYTNDGEAMFEVSDSGVGMSRGFIEQRLFHPFATTKKRGVGLGLYTCREIVQANNGSIEVVSQEGAGTTFRVVLPSAQTEKRGEL